MLAAIDVGSNTVRMLLGDVVESSVRPYRYERRITRLKGGQTVEGLAPDAVERTFSVLRDFVRAARNECVDRLRVVGTEALRQAADCTGLVGRVQTELGVKLNVLDGREEALLSSAGALSVVEPRPDSALIIDIGGGSTEFVLVCRRSIAYRRSCPLGVVDLAERSPDHWMTLVAGQIDSIVTELEREGQLAAAREPETLLIGTAGTVTSLAAMDMAMTEYDWRRVNNYRIDVERVNHFLAELSPLTPDEREVFPGLESGRGDLIVPGLLILHHLMRTLSKNSLVISDFGLLEGVLLQMSGPLQCIDN